MLIWLFCYLCVIDGGRLGILQDLFIVSCCPRLDDSVKIRLCHFSVNNNAYFNSCTYLYVVVCLLCDRSCFVSDNSDDIDKTLNPFISIKHHFYSEFDSQL